MSFKSWGELQAFIRTFFNHDNGFTRTIGPDYSDNRTLRDGLGDTPVCTHPAQTTGRKEY
jgi:hypothetical protein